MSLWPKPPIKPIAEHPRFLLTKNHIDHLNHNMESEELRSVYQLMERYAEEDIITKLPYNENGNYSPELELKIEARALLYVLGKKDDAYAKGTIRHAREYLDTVVFPMHVGDITRQLGYAMVMGAMVYDWCYAHLTDDDKQWFIGKFKALAAAKEIGYPPTGLSPIASHAGEFEIMRDLIGAGIAIYDEDTELYDLAAGRFFEEYVGYRKFFNQSGNHPQGGSYGSFRYECELWATIIYDRMGYPDILGDNMSEVAYKWFYERLPFGLWFKDGDDAVYSQQKYFLYTTHDQRQTIMSANFYKNPYLRRHAIKALSLQNYQIEHMWLLLFAEPDAGFKEPNDLPLARKTTFPLSSLVARTSWQTGLDAPTAMAHMKIQEIFTTCHMHLDCGGFQLYYKGNLAVSSGIYHGTCGGSGCSHYANYYTRTIAHNCMTVTDPDEVNIYTFGGVEYSRDGGQIRHIDGAYAMPYDNIEKTLKSEEQGTYMGPNKYTPKFSYIKGDLARGYGKKAKEYHRSMVFMDLFDKDYPAAFVCFDRMTAENKDFKKKWHLHSIEKPEIEGDTVTIKRTEYGFNGKLVNKTLLPIESEAVLVGGEGMEYTVEGVNYPNGDRGGANTEGAAWRVEISPKHASETDTFLNAMYMTDADSAAPALPMEMVKWDGMTGVMVRDRIVMFSDDAKAMENKIAITIPDNGFDTISVMIADVTAGVWSIDGKNIEVKEDEGVLYFEAKPGEYEAIFTPSEKADEIEYPRAEKAPLGDFLVYCGGLFLNQPKPTREIDGVPYVPVSFVTECGAELEEADGTVVIKAYGGEFAITESTELKNQPKMIDGTLYICLEDIEKLLGIRTSYDSYGKILKISITDRELHETLKNETVYSPVEITATGHDGHLPEHAASYDLSTRWSYESDNCYLQYDFGEEKEIGKILLATFNGQMRSLRFSVEVSKDGQEFERVFEGSASGTTDKVEEFCFDSVSARILRLSCYGNEMNMWNSVTLLIAGK